MLTNLAINAKAAMRTKPEVLSDSNREDLSKFLALLESDKELLRRFEFFLAHRWVLCNDALAGNVIANSMTIAVALRNFPDCSGRIFAEYLALIDNYFEFWIQFAEIEERLYESLDQFSRQHSPFLFAKPPHSDRP